MLSGAVRPPSAPRERLSAASSLPADILWTRLSLGGMLRGLEVGLAWRRRLSVWQGRPLTSSWLRLSSFPVCNKEDCCYGYLSSSANTCRAVKSVLSHLWVLFFTTVHEVEPALCSICRRESRRRKKKVALVTRLVSFREGLWLGVHPPTVTDTSCVFVRIHMSMHRRADLKNNYVANLSVFLCPLGGHVL